MKPMNCLWMMLLALIAASCSRSPEKPKTYPVSGRVLYEGLPVAGAVVILHLKGETMPADRPRAMTDDQGHFTLTTYTNADGAPVGDYAVTVEWKQAGDHPEQGIDLLPTNYGDPKTTKLKATIAAGGNPPLMLEMSRKP